MKTLHLSIITILAISFVTGIGIASALGGPAIFSPASYLSQITSSGNNVYLVWSDYDQDGKTHVLFRASNDGGKSFGKIIRMGDSNVGPVFSQMASYWDYVYLTSGNVIKKSSDGGHTFDDVMPINSGGTISISNVVATENNVYLTVDNIINSGNSFEILFVASADNGTTFGKPVKLFGMPESSEDYSQIAASGTNVYVVGEGKYGGLQGPIGVLYRASRDGGITFSNTVDLSGNNSTDYAPKIATVGSNVYVAWSELASDKKNSDLIFRVSTDGGETFGPRIKLNQDKSGQDTYNTDFIQLLAHDQIVYVKWWDVHFFLNGTESDHLMFKRMPDGDATIGKIIEFTGNNAKPTDIGHNSIMSVGGNNVYALWSEYPNLPSSQVNTFFKKSSDGGFSFDNAINLNMQNNETGVNVGNAQMAAFDNNVYVAADATSQSRELLFRASNDNGNTFGEVINLNQESIVPEFPFTIPVLLISIVSVIVFYRMKFRK